MVDLKNNAFLHIRSKNIEIYCLYTANLTNYMTKNKLSYTIAKDLRKFILDTDYNKAFMVHLGYPIVTVLNYTFDPTTNLIITLS